MPRLKIGQFEIELARLTLTTREAAKCVDQAPEWAYELVRSGRLDNISFERQVRIDPEQFARLLEALVDANEAPPGALARLADLLRTPR